MTDLDEVAEARRLVQRLTMRGYVETRPHQMLQDAMLVARYARHLESNQLPAGCVAVCESCRLDLTQKGRGCMGLRFIDGTLSDAHCPLRQSQDKPHG